MTSGRNTIAVVGGSLAGLRAAEALRHEGFDGRLLIVSAENHLPYDRPPMSKRVLAGDWTPERAVLRGGDQVDAEWLFGRRAVGLDAATRQLTLDGDEHLACQGIVIATGAFPRRLPHTPALAGIHTLRTMSDCVALRDELAGGPRVAVVGGGFIGSEVASTCRQRGLDVVVIEALDVPLERALGSAMGAVIARLHGDNGVSLKLGVGVDSFHGGNRIERVRLSDGTVVDADVVVLGVGVAPETAWLADSGLTLDNGVVCDAWCQAAPGVVAAGDVARWYNPMFGVSMRLEHWTNAAQQGEAAARTLLRGATEAGPYAPCPYFWSDQHGAKIQFVGYAAGSDDVMLLEGTPEDGRFVAGYGRDGRLVGALLFNRAALVAKYQGLITGGAAFPPSVALPSA